MTTIDIQPNRGAVGGKSNFVDALMRAELEQLAANPPLQPGDIAPGQPVYQYAVNAWRPWVFRAGGAALGSGAAVAVSAALASPYVWYAFGTMILTLLLFAWVLGGYELREAHPTSFKQVP